MRNKKEECSIKAQPQPDKGVQSVDRALEILDIISGSDTSVRLTDIAASMKLHKTTVYRLLSSLCYKGYVVQDPRDQRYSLGNKFLYMANALLHVMDLRTTALPHIRRLAIEMEAAVNLGVLSSSEVLYIEKAETPGMPPTYSFIGKRASVHCTALGKAIMAYTDAAEVDYILQRTNFTARTKLTIIDQQQYLRHLQTVKQQGYAIDDEEYDWGIRCIAAPVFDFRNHVIGGISVTGPTSVMTKDRLPHIADDVKRAAMAISNDLGCSLSSR